MAFTQADIDGLKGAIAKGVRSVQRNGEMVTYNSLAEMKEALRMMESEVAGPKAKAVKVFYPTTSRGL